MLLTAGCSFVWGDELEGFDNDPPTHWDLTFTHLLADKLQMPYVNLGMCGSSNDRIFRDVIDHLHDPEKENPSHIVIMWSAWQRAELIEEQPASRLKTMGLTAPLDHIQFSPFRISVLNPGRRRELLTEYYEKHYDSKTDISHGVTKMKTMEVICKSLGIKLIQGAFHGRMFQNILRVLTNTPSQENTDDRNIAEYVPEFAAWLKQSISSLDDSSRVGLGRHKDLFSIGVAIDDLKEFDHPGERSQVIFADFLHHEFEKL